MECGQNTCPVIRHCYTIFKLTTIWHGSTRKDTRTQQTTRHYCCVFYIITFGILMWPYIEDYLSCNSTVHTLFGITYNKGCQFEQCLTTVWRLTALMLMFLFFFFSSTDYFDFLITRSTQMLNRRFSGVWIDLKEIKENWLEWGELGGKIVQRFVINCHCISLRWDVLIDVWAAFVF